MSIQNSFCACETFHMRKTFRVCKTFDWKICILSSNAFLNDFGVIIIILIVLSFAEAGTGPVIAIVIIVLILIVIIAVAVVARFQGLLCFAGQLKTRHFEISPLFIKSAILNQIPAKSYNLYHYYSWFKTNSRQYQTYNLYIFAKDVKNV